MAIARARIAEEAERRTGLLDLSDLALDALAKELASLTALRQLTCGRTQVSDLTPLASLTALQQLDCWNTQVRDLTPLASLTKLQQLDCSYTKVSDLTPLASLTKLQQLYCGARRVSDLTPLAGLTKLRRLDCCGCWLSALPSAIPDNSALELFAVNAHVPGLPYGLLSQGPREDSRAKVRAHFDDLAKGAVDLTDVKLLLLGNGGVGKAQIARWLSGAAFDPKWDSTHGISIFGQSPPDSIAARLHLRMWDFGGQDIYHGTHAMFLHGPAVLLSV